jgi:TonB-dependent starch-binding outer membrane protein SusC
MKKFKNLTLFLLLLLSFGELTAQTSSVEISGKITDGKEALVGASVLEKGTSNGAVTDIDGNYKLLVKNRKATLVVSFVGYKSKEVAIENAQVLNIQLDADATLEELVVVGYGTQKKAVVTGAIAKVKGSDLENLPVSRIEQSLSGRTAGVFVSMGSGQPGEGATVRIRGTTSINGSDPLYVVDGVPVTGGIDYLNQADVESIEVLKDAASAAIYGARAAAGVIIVTTKQGKAGKTAVTYNMYIGQQAPARKLALLNGTQYATLMNEASVAAKGEVLFKDPSVYGTGTDWQDAVFNKAAPMQNHELGFSVGNDKSKYYASFGYYNQTGIAASKHSSWERYTARINSTHKLNDYFNIGTTVGYTRVAAKGTIVNSEYGGVLSRAANMDPLTPVIETDPSVLSGNIFKNFAVVRDETGAPYGISKYVSSEILNPVAATEVNQGSGYADKIVANAFLEVEPIKGLKYRSTYGADLAFYGYDAFKPIYYLNAANRSDVTGYTRSQSRGLYWIWNNTLSYTKALGSHNFSALVGQEANKNHGENVVYSVQNIPVNNIKDASLNYASVQADQSGGGYEYDGATLSYFGRVNYDYAGKYLLTALLRYDGSPRFGPNNKFGQFPSVSVGWVLSEEDFIKNIKPINFLKIRASWGVTGSDRIGDFRYVSTVGGGRNYTFGTGDKLYNGISPNAIANPDLKWERTTQANLGFDAKLFKNLTLTVDVFQKTTSGMLLRQKVPDWIGNDGPDANIAALENTGVEVELGYEKKVGKWSFGLSGNVSFIKNQITDLGPEKKFLTGQTFSPQNLEITRTKVGESYGYFYGYKTAGIFQNQGEVNAYKSKDGLTIIQPNAKPGDFRFTDINGDGIIDANDRTKIGDPTPSLTYGFNLTVAYSGFDILLFGQGVSGNDIFKATRRFDLQMANMTADALGRWTGEGTSNTYPRLIMGDPNQNFSRSSDFYVESGAYFKIKTLQIGYTVPLSIMQKVGLTRFRVYVSGNNLKTFTKYTGFDPEIGSGNSFGVDRGFYPQARSFLFGLSAAF